MRSDGSRPWRESEGQRVRLSEQWWPGEWLEPVEPDIAKPFLERYMIGMAKRMADYLRAQGAAETEPDDVDGPDETGAKPRGVDFLNLCLIVDQDHTFPIGERNLARGDYEPDEESAAYAAMTLQLEFDQFVDFVGGLDQSVDRRGFVDALAERYGYEGDIESGKLLSVLASRAAERMADERAHVWFGEQAHTVTEMVRTQLIAWGLETADGDAADGQARDMAVAAVRHWTRCVGRSRRHTPRARAEVMRWCLWHAVLETVWRREERAYDARWRGVDQSQRDSRRMGELASSADDGVPLDGGRWNTLMGRMMAAHRKVSRGYSRWCDMMPDEHDIAGLRLASRLIADDPAMLERVLFAVCNAMTRGDTQPPANAGEAMDMLLAYACVGMTVNLGDDPACRTVDDDRGRAPGEYTYVGLRNAILGYRGYQGIRRTSGMEQYREYRSMVSAAPSRAGAWDQDTDARKTVWIFPAMADAQGLRFGGVDAHGGAWSPNGAHDGLWGVDGQTSVDPDADARSRRFHQVADKAVSRWLAAETVHAEAVDGHGHTLAYRGADPVATYQDVNAWRLGDALERFEGEAVWGSGGRLAALYRDRGHLSKGGGEATDRSVRDYAATARGVSDVVQYLAAVAGLGAMLESRESIETFMRLIDLCDRKSDERFRKSYWTLIRIGKAKRLRLTVPSAYGRRVGVRLMASALDEPKRLRETWHELKIDNLRRAFGLAAIGGMDDADGMRWRDLAAMVDAAEHTVRGVVTSAVAKLAATDRRWAALRTNELECVGSRIRPDTDGVCVFHRNDAGHTTGKGTR